MMRFCLSLTAHYSILHLTGSASFTDDPFNKCFSKSFFWLKMLTFWMYLSGALHQNCESVFMFLCLPHTICFAACSAKICCASFLSCQFYSETQAYDYMWKYKGSGRGFNCWIAVYSPPKKEKQKSCMHVWVLVRTAEGAWWHSW